MNGFEAIEPDTDDACVASVASGALLEALSVAWRYPAHGIAETVAALAALQQTAPAALVDRLDAVIKASAGFGSLTDEQLAYTRLFIGSLKMEAPPYASYYLEPDHLLCGRAAVEVQAVYRQFGIGLNDDEIEPADHLRFLLAFLSLLARRFEETGEGAFARAFADFRDAYVLSWLDEFAQLVGRCAENRYYPALAGLTLASLRDKR